MNSVPGSNWQLMLADLSILLFLMTFSALAHDHAPSAPAPKVPAAATVAEPVAIWRADDGAPSLAAWLQTQTPDPRMRVNVHGGYTTGHRDRILGDAGAVSTDPALAGRDVRLILEPAPTDFITVTLSYDRT